MVIVVLRRSVCAIKSQHAPFSANSYDVLTTRFSVERKNLFELSISGKTSKKLGWRFALLCKAPSGTPATKTKNVKTREKRGKGFRQVFAAQYFCSAQQTINGPRARLSPISITRAVGCRNRSDWFSVKLAPKVQTFFSQLDAVRGRVNRLRQMSYRLKDQFASFSLPRARCAETCKILRDPVG